MGASNIKIFLNMKNKGWLSIEKIIMKYEKMSCSNLSNYLENVFSLPWILYLFKGCPGCKNFSNNIIF